MKSDSHVISSLQMNYQENCMITGCEAIIDIYDLETQKSILAENLILNRVLSTKRNKLSELNQYLYN